MGDELCLSIDGGSGTTPYYAEFSDFCIDSYCDGPWGSAGISSYEPGTNGGSGKNLAKGNLYKSTAHWCSYQCENFNGDVSISGTCDMDAVQIGLNSNTCTIP